MRVNEITGAVVDSAMKVHTALGPGILESAYRACLAHELESRGFEARQELELPVVYDGHQVDAGYRLDLLVNDTVIVEVKAVQEMHPIFQAQLLSYLKLSGKPVGLLINFHVEHLRDGIKRMINKDTYGRDGNAQ